MTFDCEHSVTLKTNYSVRNFTKNVRRIELVIIFDSDTPGRFCTRSARYLGAFSQLHFFKRKTREMASTTTSPRSTRSFCTPTIVVLCYEFPGTGSAERNILSYSYPELIVTSKSELDDYSK